MGEQSLFIILIWNTFEVTEPNAFCLWPSLRKLPFHIQVRLGGVGASLH